MLEAFQIPISTLGFLGVSKAGLCSGGAGAIVATLLELPLLAIGCSFGTRALKNQRLRQGQLFCPRLWPCHYGWKGEHGEEAHFGILYRLATVGEHHRRGRGERRWPLARAISNQLAQRPWLVLRWPLSKAITRGGKKTWRMSNTLQKVLLVCRRLISLVGH